MNYKKSIKIYCNKITYRLLYLLLIENATY